MSDDRPLLFFGGTLIGGFALGSIWLAANGPQTPEVIWGRAFSGAFAVILALLATRERNKLIMAAWLAGAAYFALHVLAPASPPYSLVAPAILLLQGALLVAGTVSTVASVGQLAGLFVALGAALMRVYTARELATTLAR